MSSKLPTFCAGIGQKYTEELGFTYRQYDFMYVLKDMLPNPADVEKEKAQWAIFSTLPSRASKEQVAHGKYLAVWADIDEGNPTLDQVKSAVGKIVGNSLMAIYSTKSYSEKDGKRKWRIIVPVSLQDDSKAIPGYSYALIQKVFNNLLDQNGLITDRVTEKPNQLCFLPNRGDEYHYALNMGECFDYNKSEAFINEMIATREAEMKEREAIERKIKETQRKAMQRIASGECSVIDAVNRYYDMPTMLANYGYKLKGGRYLSPLSSSGVAGVTIDNSGQYPKWVSNHGSDREFFGRGAGDIFDLICHFEYGGNRDKAIISLGDEIKSSDGRSLTEVNRDNFRSQFESGNYSDLGDSTWEQMPSQSSAQNLQKTSLEQDSTQSSKSESASSCQSKCPDTLTSSLSEDDVEKQNPQECTSTTSTDKQEQTESASDSTSKSEETPSDSTESNQELSPWELKAKEVAEQLAIDEALNSNKKAAGGLGEMPNPDSLDDTDPDDYFDIVEGGAIGEGAKPADWLIGGILESDSIGMLAGSTGSFKTFVTLRLAFSVATGADFMGHQAMKLGKVLYLFGEGANGLRRRVKALEIEQDATFDNLLIPNRLVDITDADDRMMIDRLVKKHKPILIIYDTLNSVAVVDNNSSREVSSMMKDLRKIGASVKATSLIVHHFGKDKSRGMEGSHAFTSNSDFVLTTDRDKNAESKDSKPLNEGLSTYLNCVKQKDSEGFSQIVIGLKVVNLGFKEKHNGKEATSLVATLGYDLHAGIGKREPTRFDSIIDAASSLYKTKGGKSSVFTLGELNEFCGLKVRSTEIKTLIKTGELMEVGTFGRYYPADSEVNEFELAALMRQALMDENKSQGLPSAMSFDDQMVNSDVSSSSAKFSSALNDNSSANW